MELIGQQKRETAPLTDVMSDKKMAVPTCFKDLPQRISLSLMYDQPQPFEEFTDRK